MEEVERYAPAILQVMPESMEQTLASLRSRYGSYGALAEALGVTGAVDQLRRTVLIPA